MSVRNRAGRLQITVRAVWRATKPRGFPRAMRVLTRQNAIRGMVTYIASGRSEMTLPSGSSGDRCFLSGLTGVGKVADCELLDFGSANDSTTPRLTPRIHEPPSGVMRPRAARRGNITYLFDAQNNGDWSHRRAEGSDRRDSTCGRRKPTSTLPRRRRQHTPTSSSVRGPNDGDANTKTKQSSGAAIGSHATERHAENYTIYTSPMEDSCARHDSFGPIGDPSKLISFAVVARARSTAASSTKKAMCWGSATRALQRR